jgi:hypothetical protein
MVCRLMRLCRLGSCLGSFRVQGLGCLGLAYTRAHMTQHAKIRLSMPNAPMRRTLNTEA